MFQGNTPLQSPYNGGNQQPYNPNLNPVAQNTPTSTQNIDRLNYHLLLSVQAIQKLNQAFLGM